MQLELLLKERWADGVVPLAFQLTHLSFMRNFCCSCWVSFCGSLFAEVQIAVRRIKQALVLMLVVSLIISSLQWLVEVPNSLYCSIFYSNFVFSLFYDHGSANEAGLVVTQ